MCAARTIMHEREARESRLACICTSGLTNLQHPIQIVCTMLLPVVPETRHRPLRVLRHQGRQHRTALSTSPRWRPNTPLSPEVQDPHTPTDLLKQRSMRRPSFPTSKEIPLLKSWTPAIYSHAARYAINVREQVTHFGVHFRERQSSDTIITPQFRFRNMLPL
ncbi:hypothetical protein CERSUDRAFT_118230 [Gelatoporia subvermispora B]|uniref:Uncharacterized protein n=1 Tax=Ceriporiopsis subvermispora (strain B) TaxID=914234 RepID=M2R4M2_CERS8|nr:hypothetical protein CERSUDRAFT_118230 [Gelatoporia subvermispora B]